ncbi:FAD-dependent oxidoreductase [Psychromonas sp. KJ10-10]|uniref:FAD-dependent oxidoreductase n=1 Tax=Psychromonas sp. KJ10-10 TaxID=3391823 RepID=UPI0039B601DB
MKDDIQLTKEKARIAIIGGGIAGATVALCLGELGLDVTLIEKGPSLVNGPPICHLHAGGNLYREISEAQCITLLHESIELLRLYPNAVDYRPTLVAVPKHDKGEPLDLLPRLEKLRAEYQQLIANDAQNEVLSKPEHYFKLFEREDLEALKHQPIVDSPSTLTEWLIPVAHHVDLDQLKFPVILIQEYGLNLFRLATSAELTLQKMSNCSVLTNSKVTDVESTQERWKVNYENGEKQHSEEFDYLINAAGFRSGLIDDMLGFERKRLVEFKVAYVTQWPGCSTIWPEVIFFGDRGTPEGMAQFTPYPDGYFQLHGMTESITLFDNGLVKNSENSAQPKLDPTFTDKIDKGWPAEEVTLRSQSAINHVGRFIPEFAKSAIIGAKPLYGAQQIPGDDADLRLAGVSFVGTHYARCEIVKASSALKVADDITEKLSALGYLEDWKRGRRNFNFSALVAEPEIESYAQRLCKERQYPISLASCNVKLKEV